MNSLRSLYGYPRIATFTILAYRMRYEEVDSRFKGKKVDFFSSSSSSFEGQYQKGYRASCPAWQKVEASHESRGLSQRPG